MPAIKELNDTGYFEISINEVKVGRKIDSIDFIVKDLDKRKYFTKEVDTKEKDSKELNEEEGKSVEHRSGVGENKRDSKKDVVFYVPDKDIFTVGTLRSFKIDFADIDFRNSYMTRAFNDAVMITLDRDDTEIIKAVSYKFFKGTLINKIQEYKNEEESDENDKLESDLYW